MKKMILPVLLGLLLSPVSVSAAWWNPFTWVKEAVPVTIETPDVSTSTVDTSLLPTAEDLYKRIAELEQKLDNMRTSLKVAEDALKSQPKVAVVAPAPVVSASLSTSDITSKVKPAIVLVETATTSAAGVIIDAKGHILTKAHAVWVKNSNGKVIGASPTATITFSNGSREKAFLVGIEEATDIAVLQLVSKKSSAYATLDYGSSLAVGDKVYALSAIGEHTNGGSTFVSGTVASKTSSAVQMTVEEKFLDNGGAMVTGKGGLVGLPNMPVCKVLEEMKNCLRYAITADLLPSRIPKILAGMKLYKEKATGTPEEILIGGYLEGFYANIDQASSIKYAVQSITGKNSFDYFDSKLNANTEEDISRVYLLKLKAAAENIYRAFDFMKSITYALKVSLINDSASILKLDAYQQKIVNAIQDENDSRFKEYEGKVDSWSKKKNEYDSYLTKVGSVTKDYLMAEGVSVTAAAAYLEKERQEMLDSFGGETLDIF